MRYPQRAADRLIDETPRLAREMYNRTLRELTQTQTHTFVLSRMTAPERLANFLLEFAERREMPVQFLEQLFSTLRRDGLLNSQRGVRGGYTLARPAEEITVLDVVQALEAQQAFF